MSTLQDQLVRACRELGLRIDVGFELHLPSGRRLLALARIRYVGAANGMVIVHAYDEISDLTKELLEAGYGFSVLSEPDPLDDFDLASYIEMFSDWGWSGDAERRPSWMAGGGPGHRR